MEIRLKLYMDSYSYCLVHSKKKTISKSHRFHCFYLLKQFKPKIDINHLDFDWNKNILTFIREIFWVHKFIYQLFVLYLSIQSLHFLAIWIELFMAFAMTVLKFWITSFDPRTERLFRTIIDQQNDWMVLMLRHIQNRHADKKCRFTVIRRLMDCFAWKDITETHYILFFQCNNTIIHSAGANGFRLG